MNISKHENQNQNFLDFSTFNIFNWWINHNKSILKYSKDNLTLFRPKWKKKFLKKKNFFLWSKKGQKIGVKSKYLSQNLIVRYEIFYKYTSIYD